jgi:methylmalonyl-CoA mutase cobalamin-binding subunit
MGFLDRVRAVRDAYQQVDANVERWARIIAIDPGSDGHDADTYQVRWDTL